jgi:L-alanine-DL-glutamate epimerase-like enolase superfamily enzyme
MRIVQIESMIVEVPLREPVTGVHGVTAVQKSVLVRALADDGVEGWGDVDPTPGYTLESVEDISASVQRLLPALHGLDPFNIHRALAVMDETVGGAFEAKAAIEMAFLDLKGRALGVPVHSLLGGRLVDEVPLNAWIGAVPPARAAREALDWLARGFTTAKIKVSGAGPEGLERVAAVRAAVGGRMALRVDFNESLAPGDAVPFIRALVPYDLALVEQPVPRDRIDALAAIRRQITIPLMADESVTSPASLIDIIKREAADIVKVKVMKQGGLLRTRSMVDCAAAAGLRVVIGHGFGLALSTLAEAALAATSAAVLPGCEAVGPLKMAGDVVAEPIDLGHGVVKLPDVPGLGATVDPDAVARYRRPHR